MVDIKNNFSNINNWNQSNCLFFYNNLNKKLIIFSQLNQYFHNTHVIQIMIAI
jgi:hypothetical protein